MSLLFIGHPKETDLALFAGGELGPLTRWRIEHHLQLCHGCQESVADFFHLQSEVRELAEMPAVDWNALAHGITARVQHEPAAEETTASWFGQPRAWQAGLAAAAVICTIAVVRQFPTAETQVKEAPAVAESSAAGLKTEEARGNEPATDALDAVAGSQLAQAEEARESDGPQRESNEAAQPADTALASASPARNRQDEGLRARASSETALAPDLEAQPAPAVEPPAVAGNVAVSPAAGLSFASPAEGEAGDERRGADRDQQSLAYARAANQAPAPAPPARTSRAEADSAELRDQASGQRAVALAELGQARRGAVPTQQLGQAQRAPEKKTAAENDWVPERGFTVLPAVFEDPTVDVGVAADGWMSVRSVDASTGTITITDVYVP